MGEMLTKTRSSLTNVNINGLYGKWNSTSRRHYGSRFTCIFALAIFNSKVLNHFNNFFEKILILIYLNYLGLRVFIYKIKYI